MFGRPDKDAGEGRGATRKGPRAPSLMGDDLVFEGDLSGEGELHVDGLIRGDVRVGRLTLGERGCVQGAITADTVEVWGRVAGSIAARQVSLHAGAQVEGDVTHEELTIEAGAHFQGRSLRPSAAKETGPVLAGPTPLLAISS